MKNQSEKRTKYLRQYYQEHKEYFLKKQKEWNEKFAKEHYVKNRKKISERQKQYYRKHAEERKAYSKKHYQNNKEYYKKYNLEYHRKHALGLGHPCKMICGLNKRDWPGYCELCGRENVRLHYHHWDDKNLSKGMWVCLMPCHQICEQVDKQQLYLVQRYKKFKKLLDREDKNAIRKKDYSKG